MKKEKQPFIIDDYNFKIIKMNVFSGKQESRIDDIDYYLLVDENNFIHDFKVVFHQINITRFTTPSHRYDTNVRLSYRIKLLNELGLKNSFEKQSKKEYKLFNQEEINKLRINYLLFNLKMNEITLQNVIYLIQGSNPSGEGRGTGKFYTLYKSNSYCLSFFLQSLNVSKEINSLYLNPSYESIWSDFKKGLITPISFEAWIDNNNILLKYLREFNWNSNNWKKLKNKFKSEIKKETDEFKWLENEVIKLRLAQKENIKKLYKTDPTVFYILDNKEDYKNYLYYKYFNIRNPQTNFVHAHILPVSLIKQKYKFKKNEKILEQISDTNNFLPLPENVHSIYDRLFFYWNENGEMCFTNKPGLNKEEVINFKNIDKSIIPRIKQYLKWYKKEVIEKL